MDLDVMDLEGRVAVVTGAASGIGRALASRFVAEGMRVVLADVEETALAATADALGGDAVLAVPTDVTREEDVAALARATLDAFGAVHVVCNNAGVFAGGPSWECSTADYAWVLGVNVWGVIHGVRSFVPILLEQGGPAHIVNTASMAGLTAMPYAAAYHMSKHAVVAFSECLHHELALKGSQIGVSVLCPELIATRIGESERNRPDALDDAAARPASAERQLVEKAIREGVAAGLPPSVMAERVVAAIRDRRFYVLAEDAWRDACNTRLDDIRQGRNPTFTPPL